MPMLLYLDIMIFFPSSTYIRLRFSHSKAVSSFCFKYFTSATLYKRFTICFQYYILIVLALHLGCHWVRVWTIQIIDLDTHINKINTHTHTEQMETCCYIPANIFILMILKYVHKTSMKTKYLIIREANLSWKDHIFKRSKTDKEVAENRVTENRRRRRKRREKYYLI